MHCASCSPRCGSCEAPLSCVALEGRKTVNFAALDEVRAVRRAEDMDRNRSKCLPSWRTLMCGLKWRCEVELILLAWWVISQVDPRLVKGAALEHGDDIGAAAEFILNEVIDPEEENSSREQQPERTHSESSNSLPDVDEIAGLAVEVEEAHTVAASDSGDFDVAMNDVLAGRVTTHGGINGSFSDALNTETGTNSRVKTFN